MPDDMDKTWAWVSLIPTFGICFISGVLQFGSGLIRQTLLRNVVSGDFQYVNWICSVYSGFYNLLGPLSSFLVYKLGCRKTVLIGGTIETLGFTSSFFVKDIRHFLFSYSLLSGIGAGISYPPVWVLLGYNFDRYLPVASGIAVSGIGIGFIVMPLLTHFLLNSYGLQGTFLLMGGLTLQKWALGALMRPSAVELKQIKKFQKIRNVVQADNPNISVISDKVSELQPSKVSTVQVNCQQEIPPKLSTCMPEESSEKEKKNIILFSPPNQEKERPTNSVVCINIKEDDGLNGSHVKENDNMAAMYDRAGEKTHKSSKTDQNKTTNSCKMVDNNTLKGRPSEIKMADAVSRTNSQRDSNSCNSDKKPSTAENIRSNPCIDVVKNTNYLLFLFSNFCFTVSETLIYLVIPTYFASMNSSESEISYLFSILGIFSTLTRPLMGILANSKIVNTNILVSAPFGILGVITFFLPLMAHLFWGRCCFVVVFALYNCSIYSLINQMIVDICGIHNLSAAFGFLMFVKGIATVFGPPITMSLVKSSNPGSVFFVAGFMYEVCSLAALFIKRPKSSTETDAGNQQFEEK